MLHAPNAAVNHAPLAPFPVVAWVYDPKTMSREMKLLGITKLLADMKISPMDYATEVIGPNPAYIDNRIGFFNGNGMYHFLNIVQAHPQGRANLEAWMRPRAIEMVEKRVHKEMDSLKKHMNKDMKDVTPAFLLDFNLERDLTRPFAEKSPWLRRILMAACQTTRAINENTYKTPEAFCSMIQSQLAKFRSQNNQLFAIPCGFYLYSSGIARHALDMLSHCGLTPSYDSIHNAHVTLSNAQMELTRSRSRYGHSIQWDNTQISTSGHVEQHEFGPAKVTTGTCSIMYDLRGLESIDDLRLRPILERRSRKELITYAQDIKPTRSDSRDITKALFISLVEILLNNCTGFEYLSGAPELKHREYRPPDSKHRTQEYVLRTTTIDEGSIDGTIEVNENIYLEQLQFGPDDLNDRAVPTYNDQKTNALIRSAQHLRAGDTSAIHRLSHLQPAMGFFHEELNHSWSLLKVHRGNGDEPGSLQYYIGLLGKVRLGSEHPDFETLVALLMQVLTAHVLEYFEIESGKSLTQLAASKPTATRLLELGGTIFDKYASDLALHSISSFNSSPAAPATPDETFRNVTLLNRDLLQFYTLRKAIASGDFGRVEIWLGTLTTMFAGASCKNYMTELLFLIQNLNKVWGPTFGNIMRDNALISPSGRQCHCMGVDKNCEHNINFQKGYLAAKGVNGTWDTLAYLSPNIPIYRQLKKQFRSILKPVWQGTTHSKTSSSDEIRRIRAKFKEHQLHLIRKKETVQDINHDRSRDESDKKVIKRKTIRKTLDVLDHGREVVQKRALKAWAKRYLAYVDGEELEEDATLDD